MSTLKVSTLRNEADSSDVAINRTSSDGTIVDLQKDGTTVGSIGSSTDSTNRIYIASSDTGIYFGATEILPANGSGARVNNSKDLGNGSHSWKNLYLSGGVYVGGTGSANYLDDYEEGTFTVILRVNNSATGVTYATNDGCYTKIGRQVTCNGHLTLTSKGSNSGELKIDGLPFNVGNIQPNTSLESGGVCYYMTNASSNFTAMYPVAIHGSTELKIYYQNAADTSMTNNLQSSNIADNWDLRFSITYFT